MSGSCAYAFEFCSGEFRLDLARGMLSCDGLEVKLRPKSFAVLRHLVERAGQLVSKNELMEAIWGRTVVTDGALTQCIIDIRRALGDHQQQLLRTVPRRGFVFDAPVTREEHAGPYPVPPSPADDRPPGPERALPPAPAPWVRPVAAWALLVLGILGAGWWSWSQQAAPVATTGDAPDILSAAPNSIAVLRFADLSPGRDQAYFADGLAEEILHLLAQSPALRVTARTSSFAFDPGVEDISTIAQQLGVDYVLEGSVRRDHDDLRITAQLIDSSNSYHVWSRTYDRKFSGILELQREIAADVATAMKVTLAETDVAYSPDRAEAHEWFLLARHLYHRRGPGDIEAALDKYRRALEVDPRHARAWVGMAAVYNVMSFEGWIDRDEGVVRQGEALENALAIDPALVEAHGRIAHYLFVTGDRERALESLRRAKELNPEEDIVLEIEANFAMFEGRVETSVAIMERLVSRDPLSAIRRNSLASFLLAAGRAEEALTQFRRASQLSPEQNYHWGIARALLIRGDYDGARAEAALIENEPWRDQIEALLDAEQGGAPAVTRLASDPDLVDKLLLAEVFAHRGDLDEAFEWISLASEAIIRAPRGGPESRLRWQMVASPFFRVLHHDPRWRTTMELMRG